MPVIAITVSTMDRPRLIQKVQQNPQSRRSPTSNKRRT
jgi:hypothetical protein